MDEQVLHVTLLEVALLANLDTLEKNVRIAKVVTTKRVVNVKVSKYD